MPDQVAFDLGFKVFTKKRENKWHHYCYCPLSFLLSQIWLDLFNIDLEPRNVCPHTKVYSPNSLFQHCSDKATKEEICYYRYVTMKYLDTLYRHYFEDDITQYTHHSDKHCGLLPYNSREYKHSMITYDKHGSTCPNLHQLDNQPQKLRYCGTKINKESQPSHQKVVSFNKNNNVKYIDQSSNSNDNNKFDFNQTHIGMKIVLFLRLLLMIHQKIQIHSVVLMKILGQGFQILT